MWFLSNVYLIVVTVLSSLSLVQSKSSQWRVIAQSWSWSVYHSKSIVVNHHRLVHSGQGGLLRLSETWIATHEIPLPCLCWSQTFLTSGLVDFHYRQSIEKGRIHIWTHISTTRVLPALTFWSHSCPREGHDQRQTTNLRTLSHS